MKQTIIMNHNFPIDKNCHEIKMKVAELPFRGVAKFCWDDMRFTIEHCRINEWNIAIENENELIYEENISTFELGYMLNQKLI